ncbi:NUDIX hydrolase [Candidatus Poriferisodalis sp.]|uniref:NUDIX hydrolase n=1 Tax=Candidatus Poriferisodalis sp. TaxID=3101277 RepID=UPI003B51B503
MSSEPSTGEIAHDESLRERLSANLARHDVQRHPGEGRKHAAVAVIVLDSDAELHGADPAFRGLTAEERREMLAAVPGAADDPMLTGDVEGTAGGAAVLLTRRGSHLRGHGGQWALPGGRLDAGETPLEAAMREADEEVGLRLTSNDLLGRLDDYPTRSGYVISPFVFWLSDDRDPVANPAEVASVHRVSMRELTRDDSPRFVSIPESDRPVVQVPIGGDLIHAPTGAVLYQFRAVAYDGLDIRVDELEQPVFAWS